MTEYNRREFIGVMLALFGGALSVDALASSASLAEVLAPLPNGKRVEVLQFAREPVVEMEKPQAAGLDGRLYTDLSTLGADNLVTATPRFYIRTRCSELLPPTAHWQIRVGGLASEVHVVAASRLDADRVPCGTHVMECSGNGAGGHFGMLSAATWDGVPLPRILQAVKPLPTATRVLVSGFDEYPALSRTSVAGASWVFTLKEAEAAFLATRMNGAPLVADHGFPVRLIMPGWYGCTCIKWVNEIKLVNDSELATAQMLEFAARTHQSGVPPMAKDYIPAVMDLAAMPVRVEKWSVPDGTVYRVIGIQWGAGAPTDKLGIRFAPRDSFRPVDHCQVQPAGQGWWLWSHLWRPRVPGRHSIQLKCLDPAIRTRRLDKGYYTRHADV